MIRSLAPAAVVALLALTAGTARAGTTGGCGIVSAAGHSWIVVAKGIPCSRATQVVRGFASRTAHVPSGATVIVASPLSGFHCILASHGRPGGSCATPGAAKNLVWLAAS
jgi:hypothetical protein